MMRSALAVLPFALVCTIWSCGSGGSAASPAEAGASEGRGLDATPGPGDGAPPTTDGAAEAAQEAAVGSGDAGANGGDGGPTTTASGCPLPTGWALKVSDHFGTGAGTNVTTYAQLHAKYYEAQYYNRDANGLVLIPNVTINSEQETYSHFEDAIVFSADHLTIQGRGQPDGGITSGEMVSVYTARSLCIEGRYVIPSVDKSWPAFWLYGANSNHDLSEIDVEQPITANQGVGDVSMYNHPPSTTDGGFPGNITIVDPQFTTAYMTWHDSSFNGSTAPHVYTACYDDVSATITRCIDGKEIYAAAWKWNASLGGTGSGADACTTFNLAVGGDWPGNVANPSAYSADLDLYSIDYYGP